MSGTQIFHAPETNMKYINGVESMKTEHRGVHLFCQTDLSIVLESVALTTQQRIGLQLQ